MTITKKTRLLPASFVGTILTVRVGEERIFKIRVASLAEGRERITVDWGDGTVETFGATLADVGHLYPTAGEYRIRLSDDVSKLGIGAASSSSEYNKVYAPMVTGFFSNGSRFTSMGPYSMRGCVNLTAFDVEGAAVETISNFAFKECAALSGELRFPRVTSILGGMAGLAFSGCTGIGVLRFGSANEAAVKSSPGWAASGGKFGAVNATVSFDL